MSSVVFQYEGRKKSLKVSPNAVLQLLLKEVCLEFNLDVNVCILKHRNAVVDTSLPFRLLNLPSNASLELSVKSNVNSLGDKIAIAVDTSKLACKLAISMVNYPSCTITFPSNTLLREVFNQFALANKIVLSDTELNRVEVLLLGIGYSGTKLDSFSLYDLGLAKQSSRINIRLLPEVSEVNSQVDTISPPVSAAMEVCSASPMEAVTTSDRNISPVGPQLSVSVNQLMEITSSTNSVKESVAMEVCSSSGTPVESIAMADVSIVSPVGQQSSGSSLGQAMEVATSTDMHSSPYDFTTLLLSYVKYQQQHSFKRLLDGLCDGNFSVVVKPALLIMIRYINNLIVYTPSHPMFAKYASIKCSNNTFNKDLLSAAGAIHCLIRIGFVPTWKNEIISMNTLELLLAYPFRHQHYTLSDVLLQIYTSKEDNTPCTYVDMMELTMCRELIIIRLEEYGVSSELIPEVPALANTTTSSAAPLNPFQSITNMAKLAFQLNDNNSTSSSNSRDNNREVSIAVQASFDPYQSYVIKSNSTGTAADVKVVSLKDKHAGSMGGSGSVTSSASSSSSSAASDASSAVQSAVSPASRVKSTSSGNSTFPASNQNVSVEKKLKDLEQRIVDILQQSKLNIQRNTQYIPPVVGIQGVSDGVDVSGNVEADSGENDQTYASHDRKLVMSSILKKLKTSSILAPVSHNIHSDSGKVDEYAADEPVLLKTKVLRDYEELLDRKIYDKALVRVKFADASVLSGYFHPHDAISTIYQWLYECINVDIRNTLTSSSSNGNTPVDGYESIFRLRFPYSSSRIEVSSTLLENHYVPSVLIYCMWRKETLGDRPTSEILDPVYVEHASTLIIKNPLPVSISLQLPAQSTVHPTIASTTSSTPASAASIPPSSDANSKPAVKSLKPKWFK